MKNRWQNLSERERRFLTLGGGAALILLIYLTIWNPFFSALSTLREQVTESQQLLSWMQTATKVLQNLQKSGAITSREAKTSSLLVIVNNSLTHYQLASFAQQIEAPNTNQVHISFKSVPFDALIDWLELIWKNYGIDVYQLKLTPTTQTGLVQIDLVLEKK